MTGALLIRPERPDDIAAIHNVHVAAFPTAAEAGLVDRLRAAHRATVSLVAERDGVVLGHALWSPVTLVAQCAADGGLGLAPIAVLPGHQRQGIGRWLITEGMAACRRLGTRFVVVLGDPNYYARSGFEPARRYGLDSEYQAGDAFRVRILQPGTLPTEGGLVRYGPEFAGL